MNIRNHIKSGYILLLTFMMLSLCVVLVTYLFNKGAVNVPFSYAMIQREKAKLLAKSGLQIAMAQLSQEIDITPKEQSKTQQANKPPGQSPKEQALSPADEAAKKILTLLLNILNYWQVFDLKESTDGIDGQIKIMITAEDGKVNINHIYDFTKHEFKGGEFAKVWLKTGFKNIGLEESFEPFEKFLKERRYRLDDITELLTIKGFDKFKHAIFFEPFSETSTLKDEKKPVFLADIFTVWSTSPMLDPWLLSSSIVPLLGLKREYIPSREQRKKLVDQWVKGFKPAFAWQQDWDKFMKPIYGKDFSQLPKGTEMMLNPKFDPVTFSVLSYGKVGQVTQKLLAIVERMGTSSENKITAEVKIKKLYWL